MKRFFSALLAVVLIVASLATVASAVQVQPGETREFTVTVSGDEFANYGVRLSADAGVTIVKVSGATYGGGVAAWASATNVTSHSFTVTVQIADDLAPGTYNVYASVIHATKDVGIDNDTDSIKDGFMAASVSANGASFVIKCDHKWGDWTVVEDATCQKEGVEKRVCSVCGETDTRAIAKKAHTPDSKWHYTDASGHYHICSVCNAHVDLQKHWCTWKVVIAPNFEEQKDGLRKCTCDQCGFEADSEIIPWDEDPEGGDKVFDLTAVVYGAAAVFSMVASAAYVTKRKSV